jgi:hypothetical protein
MVCWGVVATVRGHYLTTAFTIGWAVLIVATGAALMLALFGKTSLLATYDATGTIVRPDRWFSVLCFAGFAVFVPSGVLFVIFAPRGDIDIPMSRGMQIFSPALMGSAVVVAVVTLITAWRRGGMGYLKLTPVGIDNANVAFTNSVDWDDVVNVTDKAETKRNRKAIVLLLQDGSEEIIGGADIYVPRARRCTGWCGITGATPRVGLSSPTGGRSTDSARAGSNSTRPPNPVCRGDGTCDRRCAWPWFDGPVR